MTKKIQCVIQVIKVIDIDDGKMKRRVVQVTEPPLEFIEQLELGKYRVTFVRLSNKEVQND